MELQSPTKRPKTYHVQAVTPTSPNTPKLHMLRGFEQCILEVQQFIKNIEHTRNTFNDYLDSALTMFISYESRFNELAAYVSGDYNLWIKCWQHYSISTLSNGEMRNCMLNSRFADRVFKTCLCVKEEAIFNLDGAGYLGTNAQASAFVTLQKGHPW